MSKNSSQSVSSSKATSNTMPFNASSYRWQSTYVPTIGQLALPPTAPPGLWTPIGAPITAGFGYGFPYGQQLTRWSAPPPQMAPQHNFCCLANQRHQCGGCDHNYNNGWPSNGWCSHKDTEESNTPSTNGVAITEVDSKNGSEDESTDSFESNDKTSENKSKKISKHLKEINEELKTSLEDTRSQLRQTQEAFLKCKEKMSIDAIERYRNNLKKFGDYIRQEVNRFYQNEEMALKLKPIVDQISNASNHIKQEKEKIRQSVRTCEQALRNGKDFDLDAISFSVESLPEFPDLLAFYKNILDEIPLVFLNDLTQLKRLANNFIQTKKKLSNTVTNISQINSLSLSLPFGDDPKPSLKSIELPSMSNTLFSAPNISDLPKPDFNTLPHKSNVENTTPALELNFPRSSSPIPLPDSIVDEPLSSSTLLDIIPSNNKTKDNPISPIGKPVQPVIDLKAICAENVKNSHQKNTLSAIGGSVRKNSNDMKLDTDPIRAPNNPIPRFAKQKAMAAESIPVVSAPPMVEALKPALNQAQSKLLVKLKEKYPHMSDVHLIDSMAQTKAVLIASGHTKGFSGMKVADIVIKICEYIDSKVLSNNFSKPRLTDMNAKKFPLSIDPKPVVDNSIGKAAKKAWNTVENKTNKYDDSVCSICFDSISVINKYVTECQHFFHNSCISNWVRTDGSCPICRRHILPPGEFPEL